MKPFNGRPGCGESACTAKEIFDPVKQREHLENAKREWGGTFREEMEWWGTVYEDMLVHIAGVCTP